MTPPSTSVGTWPRTFRRDQTLPIDVAQAEQALEQRPRLIVLPQENQIVGEPEAAGREEPPRRKAVIPSARGIATHETIDGQFALDRGDSTARTLIGRGQEPGERDEQEARIEHVGIVALHKAATRLAVPETAYVRVNAVARGAPSIDRTVPAKYFHGLDGAIERDPGQHIRTSKVLGITRSHRRYAGITLSRLAALMLVSRPPTMSLGDMDLP